MWGFLTVSKKQKWLFDCVVVGMYNSIYVFILKIENQPYEGKWQVPNSVSAGHVFLLI